jgi:hypothetical protein
MTEHDSVTQEGMPGHPEDVGESTTRRGEDIVKDEGQEPGREMLGTKGESNRPYGTSTARDATGVNPQDPITDDMPQMPPGDQGG